MPPLYKHTYKRNPFHIQKERWWGPSIYSPLPSTGLQMQQEIGLHMWPQLMLWDALTDWSESSPLSDSCVYALRFQHRLDSFPESLCIYGKIRSVLIWRVYAVYGEQGGLWESMGSLYTNARFQRLQPTLQCPDDQTRGYGWRTIDSVFVRAKVNPSLSTCALFQGFSKSGARQGRHSTNE